MNCRNQAFCLLLVVISIVSCQSNTVFANCGATSINTPIRGDYNVSNHGDFAKQHYPKRIKQFASAPLNCNEIVMLGDSITEQNDWNASITVRTPIRNRGISGDTSDGVLQRLEEIIQSRPSVLFLLIGTNDLWTSNTPEKTASNINKITKSIKRQSPNTLLFVQTIFPVNKDVHLNQKVKETNQLIRKLATTNGIELIDTYQLMVDENGRLNVDYTPDGVHLNSLGYEVWSTELKTQLDKLETTKDDQ